MGMKTKPSKASAKKVVMPSKEAIMDCNNNEAGELLLSKLVNDKTIEYASRDIMLSDIRLNPDNEVFRQDDNDEDIRTLAEDIERNGLMHNLVVLPQQEGKTSVTALKYDVIIYISHSVRRCLLQPRLEPLKSSMQCSQKLLKIMKQD